MLLKDGDNSIWSEFIRLQNGEGEKPADKDKRKFEKKQSGRRGKERGRGRRDEKMVFGIAKRNFPHSVNVTDFDVEFYDATIKLAIYTRYTDHQKGC